MRIRRQGVSSVVFALGLGMIITGLGGAQGIPITSTPATQTIEGISNRAQTTAQTSMPTQSILVNGDLGHSKIMSKKSDTAASSASERTQFALGQEFTESPGPIPTSSPAKEAFKTAQTTTPTTTTTPSVTKILPPTIIVSTGSLALQTKSAVNEAMSRSNEAMILQIEEAFQRVVNETINPEIQKFLQNLQTAGVHLRYEDTDLQLESAVTKAVNATITSAIEGALEEFSTQRKSFDPVEDILYSLPGGIIGGFITGIVIGVGFYYKGPRKSKTDNPKEPYLAPDTG